MLVSARDQLGGDYAKMMLTVSITPFFYESKIFSRLKRQLLQILLYKIPLQSKPFSNMHNIRPERYLRTFEKSRKTTLRSHNTTCGSYLKKMFK